MRQVAGGTPRLPAIDDLRRRVDRDPSSVSFAVLAEQYRRTGQLEDAIRACRLGLARHPTYLSARLTLARALIESGAITEARAELATVLAAAPENLAARQALAGLDPAHAEQTAGANPARTDTDVVLAGLEHFLAAIRDCRRLRGVGVAQAPFH